MREMSCYEPQDDEDVNPVREILGTVSFWERPIGAFLMGVAGTLFVIWMAS